MATDNKNVDEKPVARSIVIDHTTLALLFPTYDGNKKSLAFYIEGVENVLSLIENGDDPLVACLIRNKLTGRAVEALSESNGARTWSEIKEILKKRFGEFRTEIQLVQELIQLNKDNSLDVFADKIWSIRSSLIEADPNKREYYEQMALNSFLDKLSPITNIMIKLKQIENLDQAISIAKQEENKLKARRLQQSKLVNKKPLLGGQQTNNNNGKFRKSLNPELPKKKINFQKQPNHDEEDSSCSEQEEDENSLEGTDENFPLILEDEIET